MSAINVNSITNRTGTTGPVLSGLTTATNGFHVTSGNVGIGTDDPNQDLHLLGNQTRVLIDSSNSNSITGLSFGDNGTTTGQILYSNADDALLFQTNGTNERIRITSTGAVGIGTTNPAGQFEISASGSGTINSLVRLVDDGISIGPIISMERRRATNADNDNLGGFYLHGYNDNVNPERIPYGAITGVIDDVTDGSEKGSVLVKSRFDGTFDNVMEFHGNGRHILPYGSANYSLYVRSVSVAAGATEDLFDLYQEANDDGLGLYMVTVMRMTASTGTRATNIIGLVSSSSSIVYSTLDSNQATLTVSGTTVRVTNGGASTFNFAAMATPLLLNGRT
jgi:hypothetical protein